MDCVDCRSNFLGLKIDTLFLEPLNSDTQTSLSRQSNETRNKPWPLDTEAYINLETVRRNGTPVVTPVWFALYDGGYYVLSAREAGR